MATHIMVASAIIGVSLLIGTAGYHLLDHLSWVDSFFECLNDPWRHGPVDPLRTTAAKLFAALHALYAGFVLLISVGIIIAPVFHRLLHRFHLERKSADEDA